MKNFIYVISGMFPLVLFNASAMSIEEIRKYSSQYVSSAKFSTEKPHQSLTLSDALTIARLQTTAKNIATVGSFLEKGQKERLRLLEYVVLYSLSLKDIYEVSAEQIRLIGILRDAECVDRLKQLDLYSSLGKYFACYNHYQLALPSISQSDKKRIQNFLKEPIEINSEDPVVKEVLPFIELQIKQDEV